MWRIASKKTNGGRDFCLEIAIAHVIIIIKSEVSILPIVIIFFVVVCLRCLLHHILSLIAYTFQENREFVFIIIVQFMMTWKSWICSVLQIVFVCLYITSSHYHHNANFSEDNELIKCLSDIFCRECEWDSAYSLSYPLYNIWGCVFSVYPSPL